MPDLSDKAKTVDLLKWVAANSNLPFDPNTVISAAHTSDWQWQAVVADMEELSRQNYINKIKQDAGGSTYWTITGRGENYLQALVRAENDGKEESLGVEPTGDRESSPTAPTNPLISPEEPARSGVKIGPFAMGRIEKTVFLSYRRTNAAWAQAIFQNLTHHGYDVFFDFIGIASGDFESIIIENIKARAHFLVVLTPSALERCGDPSDWVRREIETALATHRNIVPVMLEGFDFGSPGIASGLTGTLAPLKRYNALPVPVEYFEEAMQRLRDRYLNVSLDAVLHPASPSAQQAARDEQVAAGAAPAVTEKELTAQEWFERGLNASDLDETLRCYNEAIQLKPDYADAFNNRGNARGAKGDWEGALQDYSEAIRLRPDYAEPFNNRGNTRGAKGDWEGALQDYSEAIRLRPDYVDGFYNRGLARQAKGDLEGALQDFTVAIQLKPDYADCFNNRGIARQDGGDLEGALQDFTVAIQLRPDDAECFFNRGNARSAKSDLAGALRDYNEAIRLRPDYAECFNNRGVTRQAKADLAGALQDYNEAIRLRPDDAECFNNRGVARKAKGDLEGALQDYSEAIRLRPDFATAFNNRADALKAKGDLASAQQDYNEAIRLNPQLKTIST